MSPPLSLLRRGLLQDWAFLLPPSLARLAHVICMPSQICLRGPFGGKSPGFPSPSEMPPTIHGCCRSLFPCWTGFTAKIIPLLPPSSSSPPTTLIEAKGPVTKRRATGRMNPPCEKDARYEFIPNERQLARQWVSTGRFCLLCAITQLHLHAWHGVECRLPARSTGILRK